VLADLAAQARVQAGEGLDEEADRGNAWIVKEFVPHKPSLSAAA
jgi:hypothetical protein